MLFIAVTCFTYFIHVTLFFFSSQVTLIQKMVTSCINQENGKKSLHNITSCIAILCSHDSFI